MENLSTYLLLLMLYSFFGWICEVIYCSIPAGKFINRGFLIGPYCPIYGFGAIFVLLLLGQYKDNVFILFGMSMIIAGIIEYITSYVLEKIFNLSLWDYSKRTFNINGRVCLENLLMFGVMALAVVYVINPFMMGIVLSLSDFARKLIFTFFGVTVLIDLSLTVKVLRQIKDMASEHMFDLEQIGEVREEVLGELNAEREKKVAEYNMEKAKRKADFINKFNLKYPHRRMLEAFPKMKTRENPELIKRFREDIKKYRRSSKKGN